MVALAYVILWGAIIIRNFGRLDSFRNPDRVWPKKRWVAELGFIVLAVLVGLAWLHSDRRAPPSSVAAGALFCLGLLRIKWGWSRTYARYSMHEAWLDSITVSLGMGVWAFISVMTALPS